MMLVQAGLMKARNRKGNLTMTHIIILLLVIIFVIWAIAWVLGLGDNMKDIMQGLL